MDKIPDDLRQLLIGIYGHFNQRNIEATLAAMDAAVDWPNAMEGGIEHGHLAIRNYWTRQWKLYNPNVEPVEFYWDSDGRVDVTVHQVVKDMDGKLLADQIIHHVYTFQNGLIKSMEIHPAAKI